jgi:hypothetical protein
MEGKQAGIKAGVILDREYSVIIHKEKAPCNNARG